MDQQEIIERLSAGDAFEGPPAQRIDTHISVISLVGDRAYKLKRALETSYLDYRALDARRHFCEAEIAVNRRTAPEIYLAAIPVRLTDSGHLTVSETAEGETVEWLVCMRRFDQDMLLDKLAARAALDPGLCLQLGDMIAGFHDTAERIADVDAAKSIAFVLDENRAELEKHAGDMLEPGLIKRLDAECRETFRRVTDALRMRRRAGYVRHCHGDLHLRNICVIDDRPVLFDAIEFNESISHIDVLFDLSFLLMDLLYRGDAGAASAVFNRYLYRTRDHGQLEVLPLFIALRAGIRAHVSAMAARSDAEDSSHRTDCEGYVRLALSSLQENQPVLVAVSGLSGSGKSSVARKIAPTLGPVPGALILSSDMIRKRQCGVDPLTRLGPDAYNPVIDDAVYGEMMEIASAALSSGHAAILDATFLKPRHRDAAQALARETGVVFAGLCLDADQATLENRIRARHGDASDATVDILRRQLNAPRGGVAWHRIDAAGPLETIVRDCCEAVRTQREGRLS